MSVPVTTCPLNQQPCCREIDCSLCEFTRDLKVEWTCALCTVGARDAEVGTTPDRIVGGIYSSGRCARCGNERIALLALEERS